MRVSKQKGRLPYHSMFYPDYLFFSPTESSVTNSLIWSPLANIFPINAALNGSLMSSGKSKPLCRGLVPGLKLTGGDRKHVTPEQHGRRQRQAAQATRPQNPQVVSQGRLRRAGPVLLAAAGMVHCPGAWASECPTTTKRTSHKATRQKSVHHVYYALPVHKVWSCILKVQR